MMLVVIVDKDSPNHVELPEAEQDVLHLAENYLHKERSLPASSRLQEPPLERVQTAYNQALHWREEVVKQEGIRAAASQHFKEVKAELQRAMKLAVASLKVAYFDQLQKLEHWGVDTVLMGSGISVRLPRTQAKWERLTQRYIEREQSRMPAERIANPTLEYIQNLYAQMQSHYITRREAYQARQIAVAEKNEAFAELLDLLKAAAVVLVIVRHQRRISQALEDWGYRVIISAKNGKKN